ncbi:MAG: hypothetical protein ACKOWK_05790 [Micrococcales bacterium]
MILRQYLPENQVFLCDGLQGLRKVLRTVPRSPGVTMLNLVVDRRGRVTGKNGSSRDISNQIDYQSLMLLREQADYILTTAKTARVEQYRRSRLAPLVLLSESGNFDGIPAVESAEAGPKDSLVYLVFRSTDPSGPAGRYREPWVRVIDFGELAQMNAAAEFVVAETGLFMSGHLISRNLIQEIAISVVGVRWNFDKAVNRTMQRLGIDDATPYYLARVENTVFVRFRNLKHVPPAE